MVGLAVIDPSISQGFEYWQWRQALSLSPRDADTRADKSVAIDDVREQFGAFIEFNDGNDVGRCELGVPASVYERARINGSRAAHS